MLVEWLAINRYLLEGLLLIDSKTPKLRLLTRSDLEDIELEPSLVIRAVEDGYLAFAEGSSQCPTKMMIDLPVESRDSIAFSMLGFDANRVSLDTRPLIATEATTQISTTPPLVSTTMKAACHTR